MLEIHGSMFGTAGVFNPTLVWDEKDAILIDTGLPGKVDLIKAAVEKAGVPFERINKIIITHHDMDHIGGLSDIVGKALGKIEVLSHGDEKPYIQGELKPIKMTTERKAQINAMLSKLPEEKRKEYKLLFTNISAKVDTILEDEYELPLCGGIIAIHTKGHTLGHISLYLKKYKVLVAGDAMNVINGKLVGPNPQFTYNMDEAQKSLKKLLKYDIETVICYHGGNYSDNVNQRIAELAATNS